MTMHGEDVAPPRREHRSKRKDRKKDGKKASLPEESTLLSPARQSTDGAANAEPSAASSFPLLVRPEAIADIERQSGSAERKPKRKPSLLSAASALRGSRSRSQRQQSDVAVDSQAKALSGVQESSNNEQERWNRRARPLEPPLRDSSTVWTLLANAVCVRGSLRSTVSSTELTPLSADAQAQLQSLDAVTRESYVAIAVLHTDNIPLGSSGGISRSRGRPIVIVHLVDVCSGRPIEKRLHTSPASISTRCLDQLTWTSSHTWSSTPLKQFLSSDVLVLLEIVQPTLPKQQQPSQLIALSSSQRRPASRDTKDTKNDRATHVSESVHHKRLAWCFYKPVSDSGAIRMACISPPDAPRHRLQLFVWKRMSWLDLNQARSEYHWNPTNPDGVPAVFLQYVKRSRVPLPCSLHVEIYPVARASTILTPRRLSGIKEQASDRSLVDEGAISNDNPALPENYSHSDNQVQEPLPKESEPISTLTFDPLLKCKRQSGEPCVVPQRVLHRLLTGRRGCSCLAFSPDGLFLAAAVHHVSATAEEWVVHIHQVKSGDLWQSCRGHQSIIYSLEWGLLRDTGTVKGLVSASSDGVALLWLLRDSTREPVTPPCQIFQHVPAPIFVYCAIFHSTLPQVIITGSSDGLLRLWDVDPVIVVSSSPDPGFPHHSTAPKRQWKVSEADDVAVHSVRMEAKAGGRLFCGDSHGNITVWTPTMDPPDSSSPFQLMKTVRTGQRCVTSLHLHPRKQHLIVLAHPHALLQYELRSFLLLHKNYTGIECDELLVQAAFSPDGQFVVSGSEDGVPHLFHSVSGQRLDAVAGVWGHRFFHGFPLMKIAWSPSAHIVAMAAYGENHPVVVLCAHDDDLATGSSERRFRTMIPDGQELSSKNFQRPQRPSSEVEIHDLDARACPRSSAAAGIAIGKRSHDSKATLSAADTAITDSVQRALQRRQERLEARLARELVEAHATILDDSYPPLSDGEQPSDCRKHQSLRKNAVEASGRHGIIQ